MQFAHSPAINTKKKNRRKMPRKAMKTNDIFLWDSRTQSRGLYPEMMMVKCQI
jgi:hypothetical protein